MHFAIALHNSSSIGGRGVTLRGTVTAAALLRKINQHLFISFSFGSFTRPNTIGYLFPFGGSAAAAAE